MKKISLLSLMICLLALSYSCSSKKANDSDNGVTKQEMPKGGGPKIGQRMMGGMERPKPGPELQALIDVTVPKFTQSYFIREKGDTLQYNLFVPDTLISGQNYPLVLFMADASTPGPDPLIPLTQGYGGLVWAAP